MDKNLIIITLDALRKDRVGIYGNRKGLTPNIDSIAQSAIIYEECFSVSNTSAPSHTSLLSGCYPTTHGVRKNGWKIPKGVVIVSEILRRHGYRTAGAVSQELLSSVYGFSKGFEIFYDNSRLDRIMSYFAKVGTSRVNLRKALQHLGVIKSHSRSGRKTLQDVTRWLEKNYKDKFFLFVHFFDAHRNTFAKENKKAALSDQEFYDENVKLLDSFVGSIIHTLNKLRVKKNTVIVLMADHGECLGENNKKGHGWTLLDAEFRVPLIIHNESLKKKRIMKFCRTIDVVPTVLSMMGIIPRVKMDGVDVTGKEEVSEVYMEGCLTFLDIRGVRTPIWKYGIEKQKKEALYNMVSDPGETIDIKKKQSEITLELREKVKKHFAKKSKEQETDEHTKEMLKKLGYFD